MRVINFFVLLVLFIGGLRSYGQDRVLKFRHLNSEHGLSNTTVTRIMQDHRGFIWVGTPDGLNRYDGYHFEVFRHEPKNVSGLSHNYINTIFEDGAKELWIGTGNGLNRFDYSTRKFLKYQYSAMQANLPGQNNISSIAEDKHGNLWIGTLGGGISMLDKSRKKITRYRKSVKQNGLSSDSVNVITIDRKGIIWVGTPNGLNFLTPTGYHFQSLKEPLLLSASGKLNIVDIKEQSGRLWIGTEYNGLILFDPKTGLSKYFTHQENNQKSLGSNLIREIMIDRSNSLWVGCTNGGLNLFDPTNNTFTRYEKEPGNRYSLSQRSVTSIFEDIQRNLWVGSPRGGINLYTPVANKFNLFRQSATGAGLSYDDVRSFFQDRDKTIWVGTDGGGISLFKQGGRFIRNFKHAPNDRHSVGSDAILNISGDKKGNIFVSTYGGGLSIFDRVNKNFTTYRHEAGSVPRISSDYVTGVFEDSHSNLWVGTTAGLNLLNLKTHSFIRMSGGSPTPRKCTGNYILNISEDVDGNVWILSIDKGINKYDPVSKTFTSYPEHNNDSKDLAIGFTDSRHRFWIGRKGLYWYNKPKDKFVQFADKAGLSSEYIRSIEEDEIGNLWVSTSNGITRLNTQTGEFRKFNIGDGLQGSEFEVKSSLKASNGEIFFGGVDGFNSFYPAKVAANNFDALVFITSIDIFNKRAEIGAPGSPLKKDISLTDTIELNHNQTSFTLSFTALNYVVPENNKYRYKLDGFDKNWVSSGTSPQAVYTNINPGTYVFHVRAANNDGFWSTRERTLKIIIASPFYATWWFCSLIVLMVALASYKLIRFRHQLSLKAMEDKKNEEIHALQIQFFTNISHDFRTPLSLIIGLLDRIRQIDVSNSLTSHYDTLGRNASRLLSLINELMDFSKVASGALKLKVRPLDLQGFLQNLIEDFKYMSPNKTLYMAPMSGNWLDKVYADPQLLEKIMLNLLANSFKYSREDALITVEVFQSVKEIIPKFSNELIVRNEHRAKSYFYIQIIDNGIGISSNSIAHLFERYYRVKASKLGSGVGLAVVRSLTLLHNGDIYVYSEEKKGTQIIIALPLGEECYKEAEILAEGTAVSTVKFESVYGRSASANETYNINEAESLLGMESTDRLQLLLVDDNDELRDFYKNFLSGFYLIKEARNGIEGIEAAKEGNIDLIISDVMMPLMDGIEFCRAIKGDLETSHIPLIMLTAKSSQAAQVEGVDSGADLYLSKPVSLKLLELSIRNILAHQRKLKEIYARDYYSDAKSLAISARDKDFLEKFVYIIDGHIIDADLDIAFLCKEIGMSHTKLYNKIKSVTGQTVVEFIRSYRLKKAIQIMTSEDVSINEIAYRVGIQTQSHFTKAFKKEYGKTPTQFLQEIIQRNN